METLNFVGGFMMGAILAVFLMGLLILSLDPN